MRQRDPLESWVRIPHLGRGCEGERRMTSGGFAGSNPAVYVMPV